MHTEHNRLNSHAAVAVRWTRPMLDRFKVGFEKAKEQDEDTFTFDGNLYTVGYAYYLITFLDGDLA